MIYDYVPEIMSESLQHNPIHIQLQQVIKKNYPKAYFTVCTVFAQGNLLGNIVFFLQVPPPGRSPNIKASVSRDENCMLIIRHLGTDNYFFLLFLPKIRVCRLCSKIRVLCFRASSVKQRCYAQNHARVEVLCSNYAGLK